MRKWQTALGMVVVALLVIGGFAVRLRTTSPTVRLDLSQHNGTLDLGNSRADLEITPRPPQPLQAFALRLRPASQVELRDLRVAFTMRMDMGPNNYTFEADTDGSYVARGIVLPKCGSGNLDWFGTLTGVADKLPVETRFALTLTKPAP